MRQSFIVVLAALFGSVGTTGAQVLSDNQIYAAYCLGFMADKVTRETEGQRSANASFAGAGDVLQPMIDADIRRKDRFSKYLALGGILQTAAVQAASSQATSDYRACETQINQCGVGERPTGDSIARCEELSNEPPCSNLSRCNGPDNLPF